MYYSCARLFLKEEAEVTPPYFTRWSFVKANILLNQITIYYLNFKFYLVFIPLIHDVLSEFLKVQNMKLI